MAKTAFQENRETKKNLNSRKFQLIILTLHQCDSRNLLFAMLSTDPEVIKMVGKLANVTFSLRESIY